MVRNVKKKRRSRLHVRYAEANRVRSLLLSEDIRTLRKRDVQTLVTILDDVYPLRGRKHKPLTWQPLLVGVGIGIILVLGATLTL